MGGENREERGNRSHPIKMGNHLRVFSRRGQDLIHVLKDYSVAMVIGLWRVKLGIEGAPLAVSVMVRTRDTRAVRLCGSASSGPAGSTFPG